MPSEPPVCPCALLFFALLLATVLLTAGGCASSGASLQVAAATEPVPQPESGPEVRLLPVVDERNFRRYPANDWHPSVSGAEYGDAAATAAVLARSRSERRGANVVDESGRTAAQLVAGAVIGGFREAGYRVVDDPEALPVETVVDKFWARLDSPSRLGGTYRFECRLAARVKAPLDGLPSGPSLEVEHFVARGGPNAVAFGPALRGCLERFSAQLRDRLKAAPYLVPQEP